MPDEAHISVSPQTSERRIARLMSALSWPQSRMGEFLGVRQPTVARIAGGRMEESETQSRLLGLLESAVVDGRVTAGMDPAAAFAALGGSGPAASPHPLQVGCSRLAQPGCGSRQEPVSDALPAQRGGERTEAAE